MGVAVPRGPPNSAAPPGSSESQLSTFAEISILFSSSHDCGSCWFLTLFRRFLQDRSRNQISVPFSLSAFPWSHTPVLFTFSQLALLVVRFHWRKEFYCWKESLKCTVRAESLVGLRWGSPLWVRQTLSEQPARCWGWRVLEPHWDLGSYVTCLF